MLIAQTEHVQSPASGVNVARVKLSSGPQALVLKKNNNWLLAEKLHDAKPL